MRLLLSDFFRPSTSSGVIKFLRSPLERDFNLASKSKLGDVGIMPKGVDVSRLGPFILCILNVSKLAFRKTIFFDSVAIA